MNLNNAVRLWSGFMVLVSVALTYYVSPLWMYFTIFIGVNLIQSSFTGFCPAEMIFKKLFYSGKQPA